MYSTISWLPPLARIAFMEPILEATAAPIAAFVDGYVVRALPETAKKEAKVAIRWRLSTAVAADRTN